MNQAEIKRVLNSIKSDDLVLFSSLVKNNESVCFGRFPLLTLCYLFKAKKILKHYKDILLKIKYYKEVDEPYEIYQHFKSVAGRSLRLYLSDNSVVSPIEMLAILGKDHAVNKMYKYYADNRMLNEKISKNLAKIYTISYQKTKITDKDISISPKPLNKSQKNIYRIATGLSVTFVLILCSCLMFLNSTIGFGTSFNPYKIYNVNQLLNALSADGYYILCNDLTIENNAEEITFSGTIDGDGHTLFINNLPNGGLISNNKGLIKNLTLSYGEFLATTADSISLLASTNNGTIENVSISCESLILTCNKNANDMYITGFANENNGTIDNCNLTLTSSITTTGNGECYINGFAGINNGTISNCEYLEGNICTTDADVAGICSTNEIDAIITDCKNNASLSQTSESDGWSPNVSGIVQINYGTIEKCINNGNLKVVSNNAKSNYQGAVYIGGISASNHAVHLNCLNKGNLTVTSDNIMVYCGGISAWASHYEKDNQLISSSVNRYCGSVCDIDIITEDDGAWVFGGGLYGFLYGESSNCYSLSNFINEYEEADDGKTPKYYLGSCIGSAIIRYSFYSYVDVNMTNNYVINSASVTYHIGSLRAINFDNTSSLVSAGVNLNDGINTATENEVKQQGVYWYE